MPNAAIDLFCGIGGRNFIHPKRGITSALQPRLEHLPVFSVKKFTVTKDCQFIFSQHNIRFSGKCGMCVKVVEETIFDMMVNEEELV